jgi:LysR family transcriptional regulator, regulator for bpeEF and oprC
MRNISRTPLNARASAVELSKEVWWSSNSLGIPIYLLDHILNRSLSADLLQPLLPQWSIIRPISVAYPQNRHLSAKVRVFVDFLQGLFPKSKSVTLG